MTVIFLLQYSQKEFSKPNNYNQTSNVLTKSNYKITQIYKIYESINHNYKFKSINCILLRKITQINHYIKYIPQHKFIICVIY